MRGFIFEAVRDATADRPANLEAIVQYVDWANHCIITLEELNEGLRALVERGHVAEDGSFRYHAVPLLPGKTRKRRSETRRAPWLRRWLGLPKFPFHEIPVDAYEQACEAYHRHFDEIRRQVDQHEKRGDGFSRHIMTIRWKIPGDRYPSKGDERRAEKLAERVGAVLAESNRAEVNGFECGPGTLDMLIFGLETDNFTDSLYAEIVENFRAFGCPPGSCIIRHYEDRKQELVSDEVKAPTA